MERSKKYKIGQLYNVSSGLSKSREEFGFGHPFVTFKDVFYNTFLPDQLASLANTTEKEIKACSVKKGDIFLTRTSETFDELGMSSVALKDYRNATFNGFTKRLRLKEDAKLLIDPVYIGYYFRSPFVRAQISSHSSMTTRASLNGESIKSIEIQLPEYETQVAAGQILKSLDTKIELNRQMNQTLEQMAQALFKKYFVEDVDLENIPRGWKMGRLAEVLELCYGKALKENERQDGIVPVLGSSGIVGFHNASLVNGPGIVVGRKGNAGSVIWVHQNFFPIDTTFYVIDKIGVKDLCYHYFLLKTLDFKSVNSDSAVPGLNRNEAYRFEVLVPPANRIQKYNEVVKCFFKQMETNLEETQTLITMRDRLLPKLISGEIKIPEAEEMLA
jgi:type I restriction enzyme S subunit